MLALAARWYVHSDAFWKAPSGSCTTCASDCGAPGARTTCLVDFPLCLTQAVGIEPAGVCGRCASSADCVNAPGKNTHLGTMCDAGTGACGRCTSNVDYTNPTGMKLHTFARCNVGTGACEGPLADVPKCDGDKGTSATANACNDPLAATCNRAPRTPSTVALDQGGAVLTEL